MAIVEVEVKILPDGRMNTSNASLYVDLSRKTMAMLRSQGKGPAFIKRGKVFYFKADLDEWLEAGRSQSTAAAGA